MTPFVEAPDGAPRSAMAARPAPISAEGRAAPVIRFTIIWVVVSFAGRERSANQSIAKVTLQVPPAILPI